MQGEQVSLLVAGREHHDWDACDIDSDLMTPADAWRVSLSLKDGEPPPDARGGASCELRIGGSTVMTGRIDGYDHDIDKQAHTYTATGRDGAAVLVDCSAPVFVAKQTTLEEIIAKVVRPLGISKIRIDADDVLTREKINVEPGDTAWETLNNAAQANGLWPWFAPDGTLIIGGPDYTTPPVATLILRHSGDGNNIASLSVSEDVTDRFSEITVLGQAHGTASEAGKHNLRATVKDDGVTWYRPKIVVDHEADNEEIARRRARKLISDARVRGFTATAVVAGFRAANGALWEPGQRVQIISEPHRMQGIYFLRGRRFGLNRRDGQTTQLRLIEDGVWTLDAHPHKNKHRRGKNSAPGRIVDVTQ